MQRKVSRKGVIVEIENNLIRVLVPSESACAGCHAIGACNLAEVSEKEIIVKSEAHSMFKKGDTVWVEMPEKQGASAVFWAYVWPVVIVLGSLIFLSRRMNEGLAGLIALGLLITYYIFLWLLKPLLEKKYHFSIRHLSPEESFEVSCTFKK